MNQLERYKYFRSWQRHVEHNAQKEGDIAPNFSLIVLDGSTTICLSDFLGKKPVVLVFGSHT